MDVTVAIGTERDQIFVCVVSRRHKQRSDRRGDGFRSCGISYVRVHFAPERRRLAFVSVLARRFKGRDVIAARRSGGHILGTCKGGDRTTGALAQTGQGNQSALYSRYHRKGTYALLWSQDRRAHATNMLPKPTRLQYPECAFKVPRAHPASSCLLYCGLVGRPLKEAFDDSLKRVSRLSD